MCAYRLSYTYIHNKRFSVTITRLIERALFIVNLWVTVRIEREKNGICISLTYKTHEYKYSVSMLKINCVLEN